MLNAFTSRGLIVLVASGVFLGLLLAEAALPLRERTRRFAPRLLVNLCVSALGLLAGAVAVAPVALRLGQWVSRQSVGLLQFLRLPLALQLPLSLLLMDLTFYYWHRANHGFGFLWRFHNVHHLDPDLDVTTAFRFHFGEILLSTGFRAAQVVLLGVTPLLFATYEAVFLVATLFHHSNLRLPIRLERAWNRVIVTPRMHGIHHSVVRDEVNSNYSVVFRWWDLLHRTLRLNVPQGALNIGVPAYLEEGDNRLVNLILMPFGRQRDYGKAPEGAAPRRAADERGPERTVLEP
ncbi:MAG: sterol desaturase family protein [Planctomycetota bacterium]|jgi:sterol desaturase/sphingolipid hydroxylase (fatty acid hydroxylase superfamily)